MFNKVVAFLTPGAFSFTCPVTAIYRHSGTAGGGAGGSGYSSAGGGGGGGGSGQAVDGVEIFLNAGDTISGTIGAGGTAGAIGAAGGDGADTTISFTTSNTVRYGSSLTLKKGLGGSAGAGTNGGSGGNGGNGLSTGATGGAGAGGVATVFSRSLGNGINYAVGGSAGGAVTQAGGNAAILHTFGSAANVTSSAGNASNGGGGAGGGGLFGTSGKGGIGGGASPTSPTGYGVGGGGGAGNQAGSAGAAGAVWIFYWDGTAGASGDFTSTQKANFPTNFGLLGISGSGGVTVGGFASGQDPRIAAYIHGAVWINTLSGSSGTVSYVNGLPGNPSDTLAHAKTIADALGIKRFWIQPGSLVNATADYPNYAFDGRGYALSVSGNRNFSSCQFDNVEGLSTSGGGITCATGEIVVRESHVNDVTVGEADFVRCHLNGVVTCSQASVPYRFDTCHGVGTLAKIVLNAASQSLEVPRWDGYLTLAGMASGKVARIGGCGQLVLDNTNTGGTVYLTGNITLTDNSGGAVTIVNTAPKQLANLGTNPPVDWLNAAAIASSALNGKGDWATVGAAMTLTSAYDAAKSAASQSAVAAIPTTAPDNASITAIKAKTDSLTFTGSKVQADIKAVNGATVIGDGHSGTEWGPA